MFIYSNWKTQPKQHVRKKQNISEVSKTVEDAALYIISIISAVFSGGNGSKADVL